MSKFLDVQDDIAMLKTVEDNRPSMLIAPVAALEELSTVLISLRLQGLDSVGTLIHILHSQYTTLQLMPVFTAKLKVLAEVFDKDSVNQELEKKDIARIADLLVKYNELVTESCNDGEFAGIYTALMPILPPLTATSVIMHANKKEDTQCTYYNCPSLWALFLLIEDSEESGRKTSGIPPKELFSCFTLFHAHSRCSVAHAVIATFRFLLIYAEIPGIKIILPADPTKRSNRAIDVMKNKCTLIYAYILNTVDRSALKSSSKNASDDMPDSLAEYIEVLMCQLRARYKQLFSISLLKDHRPIRPAKPITKNNRGGSRFNKNKDILGNRFQYNQSDS
ncbi:Hypothetical protein GLP15_4816 [Giardia lamblia P15]|uniref:Uncharacterized protein n=1 Tax=Giardia intestinalis (strain P15) TaxID=658858 RepID=E1F1G0_GIAIA|nr:Hypothetical protein GLP15_4816 [Giardia lamblia P15]